MKLSKLSTMVKKTKRKKTKGRWPKTAGMPTLSRGSTTEAEILFTANGEHAGERYREEGAEGAEHVEDKDEDEEGTDDGNDDAGAVGETADEKGKQATMTRRRRGRRGCSGRYHDSDGHGHARYRARGVIIGEGVLVEGLGKSVAWVVEEWGVREGVASRRRVGRGGQFNL